MEDIESFSTLELTDELKKRAREVVIILSDSGVEGRDDWILAWHGTIPAALGWMDVARRRFFEHLNPDGEHI